MTILITGGTGKTGSRLASILHAAGQHIVVASRSGAVPSSLTDTQNVHAVKFDWLDSTTFLNPFSTLPPSFPLIDRMYLVAPIGQVEDLLSVTKPFIDLAVTKGVKRFVLLSATDIEKGGPAMGKIHEYLEQKDVEVYVLRPTCFMENLTTAFLKSIVENNEMGTTTKEGRVAFIAADDIAEAAKGALLDEKPVRTEAVIVGPDLYSYSQLMEIISEVVGRKIVHKHLSEEEFMAQTTPMVGSESHAKLLLFLESLTASGVEESFTKHEKVRVGKTHFRDWVLANRDLFVGKA